MGVDFINKFPWLKNGVVYLALIQSLAATLGSLYFSEIKHYSPCVLCWYQRILMYPLVTLLTVGTLRKDRGLYLYVLPMSILGGGGCSLSDSFTKWSTAKRHRPLQFRWILPD